MKQDMRDIAEDTDTEIMKALRVLRQAMSEDPSDPCSYAHSWHCNIAMMCYDAIEDGKLDMNWEGQELDSLSIGNDAASRFMKLLFGVETSHHQR
jgi:hypothetical protein